MKYECVNCGLIDETDVCEERVVDLEPMGESKVERVSYYTKCAFCGTDCIEPLDPANCPYCD